MNFKNEKDMKLFFALHPLLQFILMDVNLWCHNKGLPFTLTETVTTIEEDLRLHRVSKSHNQKRAADSSLHGWNRKDISDLKKEYSEKYKSVAAISSETLLPTLIVDHDSGNGFHLHFQIHLRYAE